MHMFPMLLFAYTLLLCQHSAVWAATGRLRTLQGTTANPKAYKHAKKEKWFVNRAGNIY